MLKKYVQNLMAIAHTEFRSKTVRSNIIDVYNIAIGIIAIYSCKWFFNTCIHSIAIIFHL